MDLGGLLEKFKVSNLANINFLKLVTKENLIEAFHKLATYQKGRRIFIESVEFFRRIFPSKFPRKEYVQTTCE